MIKDFSKKITILSHPNPDVDSIISGVLLQKLLISKGYNASYIIPDENISEESATICLKYGVDANNYKGEVPEDATLFLVDHYKTNIAGYVIGAIDHHPTLENIEYDLYMNNPTSSAAMQIYNLDPSVFDIEDIKRVALANLVDTNCFLSTKTNEEDKKWTINVCKDNNIDYEQLYRDGLCLTDISDIQKSSVHGFKSYNYNDLRVKSSYIQIDQIDKEYLNKIIIVLRKKLDEENLYLWVFIVHNMQLFKSTAYLITREDCEVINYGIIASRGNTIMPAVEKRIMKL